MTYTANELKVLDQLVALFLKGQLTADQLRSAVDVVNARR